jgi:cystathionine gamma-synthase
MLLNPAGRYYKELRAILEETYEDTLLEEDALFLERNSRDYRARRAAVDANAEQLCDYLHSKLGSQSAMTGVLYPKLDPAGHYKRHMRPTEGFEHPPGYSSLFSLTFSCEAASRAFFDALPCEKGPSLGTNFTLACPYTILAHWAELEWTTSWGVPSTLVRVSVGLEDIDSLIEGFQAALDCAVKAVAMSN